MKALSSRQGVFWGFIFAAIFISSSFAFFGAENASASSASGPGGTGSCSSGSCAGANSRNGYGWYEFSSASNASVNPRAMRNGQSWNNAKSQCRAVGADKVMAFIVLTTRNGAPATGVVYDYTSGYVSGRLSVGPPPLNPDAYKGDNGGSWVTNTEARSRYRADPGLPNSQWEQSVGWFCYNSNPAWSLTLRSYVTTNTSNYGASGRTITVKPGDTVHFKHNVANTGVGNASYSRWLEQRYNASNYTSTSTYPIRNSTRAGGTNIDYPTNARNRSFRIPSDAPDGALYCQRYKVNPRSSSSSSDRTSSAACARVQRWNLEVTSYVSTSDSAYGSAGRTIEVSPGQTVYFKHTIRNTESATATYSRWLEQGYNTSNYTSTSTYPIRGATRAGNSQVDYPVSNSNRDYAIPADAPHGALYCQRYKVNPRSSSSNSDRTSGPACARVVRTWSVAPTISPPSRSTAAPGNTVTWTHNIRNTGTYSTDRSVEYGAHNVGTLGTGRAGGVWTRAAGLGSGATATNQTTSVTVTQNHVGNSLCRVTRVAPQAHNNTGARNSAQSCVNVPYNWSVSASITPRHSTSGSRQPGNSISYDYTFTNNGPTKTGARVDYVTKLVRVSGVPGSVPGDNALRTATALSSKTQSGYRGAGWLPDASNRASGTNPQHLRHQISQDDVNNWVCAVAYASPRANNNSGAAVAKHCQFIPYNYELIPTLTEPTESNEIIPGDGDNIPVSGHVRNGGTTKSHPGIQWQLTQLITTPGGGPRTTNGGVDGRDPCAFFRGLPSHECETIGAGSNMQIIPGNPVSPASESRLGDMPVGTRACFALSVKRNSHTSDAWRHSNLVCLTVGKFPKVQIHGGSLSVGRSFDGSNGSSSSVVTSTSSSRNGMTFGSWAEYGILAPGSIQAMASASGLAGGSTDSLQSRWSNLTFTQMTSGGYGGYIFRSGMPNVAAAFPLHSATHRVTDQSVSVAGLTGGGEGGRVVRAGTGDSLTNLTITGGNLSGGQWAVLYANNVTISGDIAYENGPFASVRDIPQLVIIAQNITIEANVERVDAWLVARNALATCQTRGNAVQLSIGTGDVRLTADDCGDQLVVNGPVMANKLYLRRTAGADVGSSAEPAEIFNMRPDAYMWLHARMNEGGVYRTTNVRELPPRY